MILPTCNLKECNRSRNKDPVEIDIPGPIVSDRPEFLKHVKLSQDGLYHSTNMMV
jgi:hypothetical protein